uniref:tRNA wybutosine-synthesizing protein 3 homolog n=1 Tax=Haplochromis burtoni TaxID=8153 RepID=A0A3Q2VZ97_HAPBU
MYMPSLYNTAVRSTHGLEVPLSHDGTLLLPQEYITYLTQVANQKMEENHRRISRSVCRLAVKSETYWSLTGFPVKHERKKTSVYKRRRKREQHETDGCHGDGDCSVPGLEDCLDLFT